MTEAELLEYIKNRTYLCEFCKGLRSEVMEKGLIAIKNYKGMICGGVEDMKIKLSKTDEAQEGEALKEFEEVWKEHGDAVLNHNHPWVKSFALWYWLAAFRKYHKEVEDSCGQRRDETMRGG